MSPSRLLFLRLFLIGWILTTITNFPAGFTATSLNTAVHTLDSYLNETYSLRGRPLEDDDLTLFKSVLSNVWYGAQAIGSLPAALVIDRMGRKFSYILATVMITSASFLNYLSTLLPFPELMIVARAIMALFCPLSDVALILYLQESTPTHLQGTLSSLFATGYAVMCLIGMGLGILLDHSLRMLLYIPLPVGVLSITFLVFIPETPKYLLAKGDKEGAIRSLTFFQGQQEDQEWTIEGWSEERGNRGSLHSLLTTPHLRRALLLSISLLFLAVPFVPILQHSTYFFKSMEGIDQVRAQLQSMLLMVVFTISCLVSTSLMDFIPRRKMLFSFAFLAYSSFFVFSLSLQLAHPLYILCLPLRIRPRVNDDCLWMIQSSLFRVGITPVSCCFCPELVPLSHRSILFCLCYASLSIQVMITNFATLPLFVSMGGICFLPIFIVPSSLIVVVLYLYLPESADLRCEKKKGEEIEVDNHADPQPTEYSFEPPNSK